MSERSSTASEPVMQLEVAGRGKVLVLVCGGFTGALSWAPHAEKLAPTRQVARAQPLNVQYALEGRSLPSGYGIRTESGALLRALDARGWKHAIDVVGWSYGGGIALDFALEHPERIRSLVLIEPSAYWVLPDSGRSDPEVQRAEALGLKWAKGVSEDDLADFLIEINAVPQGQSPREHPRWPIWLRHKNALVAGHAEFEHGDEKARLRSLRLPVLLIVGEGTAAYNRMIIEALARDLPNARVLELPGGHVAPIASMDRFLEEVAGFQKDAAAN